MTAQQSSSATAAMEVRMVLRERCCSWGFFSRLQLQVSSWSGAVCAQYYHRHQRCSKHYCSSSSSRPSARAAASAAAATTTTTNAGLRRLPRTSLCCSRRKREREKKTTVTCHCSCCKAVFLSTEIQFRNPEHVFRGCRKLRKQHRRAVC